MTRLFHFSEDDSITEFHPHVPATNPDHAPAVWAIDEAHAPLYWFPRDCPRVTAWPRDDSERAAFEAIFFTTAPRLHAIEERWVDRVQTTTLYRYEFAGDPFEPWPDASGQWISSTTVQPLRVEPVGDLLGLHEAAGIELRVVPSLHPIARLAQSDRWDFSIVRLVNAGS